MQVGAPVGRAGGGGGGLCSLHQQGSEERGGEMSGQWSGGPGHPVENVPPASVLRYLETLTPVPHLSLSTSPVFCLCLTSPSVKYTVLLVLVVLPPVPVPVCNMRGGDGAVSTCDSTRPWWLCWPSGPTGPSGAYNITSFSESDTTGAPPPPPHLAGPTVIVLVNTRLDWAAGADGEEVLQISPNLSGEK